MSAKTDPFFLIELILAEPTKVKPEDEVILELHRLRDLMKLLAPWRKFTDLSIGLSGAKDGLVCTFSVVPSAQVYLEASISSGHEGGITNQIMLEKRKWVGALENLPLDLLSRCLFQASAATVPFRNKASSMGRAISDDMTLNKEVRKLLKAFKRSKLQGHVETHPTQLNLAGFDGYAWSKPTFSRALPKRERYGVSLILLGPIPLELRDKKKPQLQLHYCDVSQANQFRIDRACRTGSQIGAIVLIGQQENRPSLASLQQLTRSVTRSTVSQNSTATHKSGKPALTIT